MILLVQNIKNESMLKDFFSLWKKICSTVSQTLCIYNSSIPVICMNKPEEMNKIMVRDFFLVKDRRERHTLESIAEIYSCLLIKHIFLTITSLIEKLLTFNSHSCVS